MKEALLVLDLDETLLYATKDRLVQHEDFVVGQYYVYVRPNLAYFLSEMAGDFKLAIWSSADDKYVQELVDKIKPATESIKLRGNGWRKVLAIVQRNVISS